MFKALLINNKTDKKTGNMCRKKGKCVIDGEKVKKMSGQKNKPHKKLYQKIDAVFRHNALFK